VPQQMIWFFVSIAFSLIAWGIVTARYIWPELRLRPRVEALRPLLILHSFRFIGLALRSNSAARKGRVAQEDRTCRREFLAVCRRQAPQVGESAGVAMA
jgi:hypothetical protein